MCLGIGTCTEPVGLEKLNFNTTTLPNATQGKGYSFTLSASGGDGSYSWRISEGNLPPGLSLSTAGAISGTPTEVGLSSFTVEVTSTGAASSKPLTLEVVYGAPDITTTELRTGTIGESYADTLKATGGDGTYAWSVIGSDMPPGITLTPSGVFRGRARTPGEWALTLQVTSVGLASQKVLNLYTEHPDVAILTRDIPGAEVGITYSSYLLADGGDGEYAWSIASGALPQGMNLSEAGEISGTPTVTDTTSFSVRVTSSEQTADSVLAMEIVAGPLTITTSSLSSGEIGSNFDQTIEVTGGDGTNYAWSLTSGELPPGLGLGSSGSITGTPTAPGTSNFTVGVESGSKIANKPLSITIVDSLAVSTSSLPDGTVNALYSQILEAAGGSGTYSWALTAGGLPTGLSLSSTGSISGTPTEAGTSSFSVTVTSEGISTSATLSIAVNNTLSISTSAPSDGVAGLTYEYTLEGIGGDGSYSWSILSGSLPDGLSLSSVGVITGTPTAAGTSSFSVEVTSAGQTASRTLSLTVAEGLTVTTNSLPSASVGVAYSQSLAAQAGDGSYSWSLSSGTLPTGLTLSTQGVVSGTPTVAGTSNFSVQVTSAGQTATKALSILVYDGLNITSSVMRQGIVGSTYSDTLEVVGGDGSYTWLVASGSLPSGLSLSTAGVISGTPTAAGTTSFTVQASSAGATTSGTVSIEVLAELSIPGAITLSSGIVGHAYSHTLSATGGDGSYSWTLQTGTLHAGLSLSAQGVISGTPTTAEAKTFAVRVASAGQVKDKSLSLTIGAAVSITTSALPNGSLNAAYSHNLSATGGDGSYSWFLASGTLPTGLSLSSAGTISGTPTATDTTSFSVSVVSAGDTASASLSIIVTELGENEIPFGSTLTGLSGGNDFPVWTVEVPAGQSQLVIELTGGSVSAYNYQKPQLYVAQGTSVGTSSSQYDCWDGSYPGRCVFENPASGTWSIMVTAVSNYSGVKLAVNPEEQTLTFGSTLTGLSGGNDFPVWTVEVPAGQSQLVIELTGGSVSAYNYEKPQLYVAQGTSVGTSSSQYDCWDSSYPGRCVFENPTAGTWSIMVTAVSNYSGVSLKAGGS